MKGYIYEQRTGLSYTRESEHDYWRDMIKLMSLFSVMVVMVVGVLFMAFR
jgi:hypothetical protein